MRNLRMLKDLELKDLEMEYTTPSRKSPPVDVSSAPGYDNLKLFAAYNMVTPLYRESRMLTKIRSLPPRRREELNEIVDDMLARECHRKLVREAFDISTRSLARDWGADDDKEPDKGF